MENASFFLGNGQCSAAAKVNFVAGIEHLVQTAKGADGERNLQLFPVTSQLTWFWAVHPEGRICSQIVFEDEYRARAEATIYAANDRVLATACGSCMVHDIPFKYVEAAETVAIRRALNFAGFGCQLVAKAFEDVSDIANENPAPATPTDNGMPPLPSEVPSLASEPDSFKANKLVSTGNNANGEVEEKPRRKRGAKSGSVPEPTEIPSNQETGTSTEPETPPTTDNAEPETITTTSPTEDEQQGSEAGEPDVSPVTTDPNTRGEAGGEGEEAQLQDTTTSPENTESAPIADISVESQVAAAVASSEEIEPTAFELKCIGGNFVPGELYLNKKGGETGVLQGDLVKALRFFGTNPELVTETVMEANQEHLVDKPLKELAAHGTLGWEVLRSMLTFSTSSNVAFIAAILFWYYNTTKEAFPAFAVQAAA
ncbi:MAG: hypothetical protein FWE32_02070 [Oscillospiraceae bacterium]|nr:hypothetical protein [Oscillospiraceae bacterium]